MTLDYFGATVVDALNGTPQIPHDWDCAAWVGNQNIRNWVRIYRRAWYAQPQNRLKLRKAKKNGNPVFGSFPILWFEIKAAGQARIGPPYQIYLPIASHCFQHRRLAYYRDTLLHNFLDNLHINHNDWSQACIVGIKDYLAPGHHRNEIGLKDVPNGNAGIEYCRDWIAHRFQVIDMTLGQ